MAISLLGQLKQLTQEEDNEELVKHVRDQRDEYNWTKEQYEEELVKALGYRELVALGLDIIDL